MDTWTPITEAELWNQINRGWKEMTLEQRRLWEMIRIDPVKWAQEPYGTGGGGFWVVAIYGSRVKVWWTKWSGRWRKLRCHAQLDNGSLRRQGSIEYETGSSCGRW
jgi:hypothetical protein